MLPKTYKEIKGMTVPQSIEFKAVREDKKIKYVLGFDYKPEGKKQAKKHIETDDKRFITKFGQLHGFSYMTLLEGIENGDATAETTEQFIKDEVTDKNRTTVLLYDDKDCVNIVSERHKQLPMTEIHEMVQKIGVKLNAKDLGLTETEGGYINTFEVGKTPLLSIQVTVDYGRNDAKGRASIRFTGGGHIFVCSNQIIPYVHTELRVSKEMRLTKPKIIHTLNVTEQTQKNVVMMFNEAKESAIYLSGRLESSKKVKMSREVQIYALKLVNAKHEFGDKWMALLMKRIEEEDETLFGLSQALTYIGTKAEAAYMKDRLCRVGGQVAILGEELVPLLEKNLKQHKVDVVELRR